MSTTTTRTSPSSIARTMAAAQWPDVQHSAKLAPGIFWYSCAGHGGAVAIIGEADLPAHAIEAARACGLVDLVVIAPRRRYTTERYTAESLRQLATQYNYPLHECWSGEEDCGWATLALVSPAMREGMSKRGGGSTSVTESEARETCERWQESYLIALEPSYTPRPDGEIERRRHVASVHESGGVTLASASGDWADGVRDGDVRVLFRGKNGRQESYTMAAETYAARSAFQWSRDATPEDFASVGPIVREVSIES